MDPRIVVVSWLECVAVFGFVSRSRCGLHELFVALAVIEVEEREGFVGQHQCRAAVDDVVDQDFALSQSIAKWFDFVRRAEGEIVVGQPDVCLTALAQFDQKIGDIETRTDIEEWFVERKIKLKHLAPRPVRKVNITGHTEALYLVRRDVRTLCASWKMWRLCMQ